MSWSKNVNCHCLRCRSRRRLHDSRVAIAHFLRSTSEEFSMFCTYAPVGRPGHMHLLPAKWMCVRKDPQQIQTLALPMCSKPAAAVPLLLCKGLIVQAHEDWPSELAGVPCAQQARCSYRTFQVRPCRSSCAQKIPFRCNGPLLSARPSPGHSWAQQCCRWRTGSCGSWVC